MAILVIFFWFIISNHFEHVLLSKIDIVVLMAKENEALKKQLIQQIDRDYNTTQQIALENEGVRMYHNFELLKNKIGPFLYSFVSILGLLFSYICIKRVRFDTIDFVLILIEICAYSTEYIFYHVIISGWIFIGDQEMYKILLIPKD